MRTSIYRQYDPSWLSVSYPAVMALGLLVIALATEAAARPAIRRRR